jgi:hypothetical protein
MRRFEALHRGLALVLQRDLGEHRDLLAERGACDQRAVALDQPFALEPAHPIEGGAGRQVDRFRQRLHGGAAVLLQQFQQLQVGPVQLHRGARLERLDRGEPAHQLLHQVALHVAVQQVLFRFLGQHRRFVEADVALLQQLGFGDQSPCRAACAA